MAEDRIRGRPAVEMGGSTFLRPKKTAKRFVGCANYEGAAKPQHPYLKGKE